MLVLIPFYADKPKIWIFLSFVLLADEFILLKVLAYGQHSLKRADFRLEDLFSFPPDDLVMESFSANFKIPSLHFTSQNVKIVDSEVFCPATENARTRTLVVLLAILTFGQLIELVRWIVWKIRDVKSPKNSTTSSTAIKRNGYEIDHQRK